MPFLILYPLHLGLFTFPAITAALYCNKMRDNEWKEVENKFGKASHYHLAGGLQYSSWCLKLKAQTTQNVPSNAITVHYHQLPSSEKL